MWVKVKGEEVQKQNKKDMVQTIGYNEGQSPQIRQECDWWRNILHSKVARTTK